MATWSPGGYCEGDQAVSASGRYPKLDPFLGFVFSDFRCCFGVPNAVQKSGFSGFVFRQVAEDVFIDFRPISGSISGSFRGCFPLRSRFENVDFVLVFTVHDGSGRPEAALHRS